MGLRDHEVERDMFEAETVPFAWCFPCGQCRHRHGSDKEPPCSECDHSATATSAKSAPQGLTPPPGRVD